MSVSNSDIKLNYRQKNLSNNSYKSIDHTAMFLNLPT